ncbi:MAG: benM 1 [Verrucomicrobiales bacterium]|nr:benM 1 [Verrucomicrobiales bacterium]
MNLHHLEIFYYVAKHGGISEAVRNIPYGIQQPAVSGQIAQLEEFLGVTLFQRRPFELTAPGRELFAFVCPFFEQIGPVMAKLQGGVSHNIRIGASEIILREHLPDMVQKVRTKFPQLKISLREANQPELQNLLERDQIDIAITLIHEKTPAALCSQPLLNLPVILLVHKSSKLKSADELWRRDKITESLIALPAKEIATQQFQQELARRGIDWFPSVEVSSLNLVETYVAKGYGIGLSIRVPQTKLSPDVRALELPNFPSVTLGVIWRGKPSALTQTFVDELSKRARDVSAEIK